MCEHRFCSQTKTIGDRNRTACFSLANIFNQSTNKSFGAKLQSEVTGGFTQVRTGNLINQSGGFLSGGFVLEPCETVPSMPA